MTTSVIFDVGGVLIDWNPRHLYRRLFDGDVAAMEHFLAQVCTAEWNRSMDAGRPFSDAVAELSAVYPEHASLIAAYDECWEEMVPGALEGTIAVVRELRERGVALYVLSNFSMEKFALMRTRFDVFALFEGLVISGEIGLVKPDPAIYHYLLRSYGLKPEDCLFIDDLSANVEAARREGIAAHQFVSPDALRQDLSLRGLL